MDRIVLITKPTALDELLRKYHNEGAAAFALESRGQSIEREKQEHAFYTAALEEVRRQIPSDVPVTYVTRDELPTMLLREKDLVIAVGPDGLFANLAQYIGDQPVLTVNPYPQQATLMLFRAREVGTLLARAQKEALALEALPFVKATFDDGRVLWGINDIFVGRKDKISARYEISFDGESEEQSSDGVLIATGVGSSGWMRSYVAMIESLVGRGAPHALQDLPRATDQELVFLVQGPFPSPETSATLVTGRLTAGSALRITSRMPRGGYAFSDGMLQKAMEFGSGCSATITVGERSVKRVVR